VITKQARILPGDRDHGMAGYRMHHQQRSGVIGNLRAMERLYQQAGRSKEMVAVYNDVLAKSQNPRVRDYVHKRLARLQAQPANVDQAIATLRKGLDENLANEAKMRAEREKMRAVWQQRASEAASPAK
jgi:predicted negative regulator of RcsB-dependent stress response